MSSNEHPAADEPRDLENGTADNNAPRQPRSSVPSFLFISFVLFMLMGGRGDEFASSRDLYVNGLQSLNHQLSNYTAWLNGTATNFTLPAQDPNTMPLVSSFIAHGRTLDPRRGSYYANMTGYWHAAIQAHNLTALNATERRAPWRPLSEQWMLPTNLTLVPARLGAWNWTRSNKVTINIGDKLVPFARNASAGNADGEEKERDIAIIHGKIEFSDPMSSDELHLDFEGVHVVSTGTVYAFAEGPGRGNDIRALPALVPEGLRNDTARAAEKELRARINRLQDRINTGVFEQDTSSTDDSLKTNCSFQFYAQLDPTNVPEEQMRELEREFEEPTGITTVRAPELALEAVLLSQDCGLLYEVQHATGVQTKRLYGKITTYSGISTIVSFILLALFRKQATESSSAAGLSKVSRYTFLIQSLIDAISFVGHVTVAILADGQPSLSVLAPAGLSCLLFIYEAQFAVLIGQMQAHEDVPSPAPAPPTPAPPPSTPPASQPPTEGSAPAGEATPPTTAPPTTTPTPAPAPAPTPAPAQPNEPGRPGFLPFLWNHIRTDPAARLWTIMSLCLIILFRVVIMLSLPLFFISMLYLSMWAIQIYRGARRSRSSGLSTTYLVGTTLGRLFYACYFLGCPKNIFDVEPRPWIFLLALLMLAQAGTLDFQTRFGPTFFLPRRVARAETYDYHPPLPLPDPEAPEQSLGDCAICMDAIEVDDGMRRRRSKSRDGLLGGGGSGAEERAGFFRSVAGKGAARKSYSLAPCHHLFHTACLERWLAIKNICPQCRRPLPPL
ncbi:uncharacterized protein BXZ73DRAFT_49527 [Epithele typhae]|uniref:uncharacterized protein n=2 Tax=Epithele typhae TaxID=378194 RepID=UPI0020073974|nr:uncharacterized protein BXZ73DRAFT_49527 [Epithele typhae]KAH9926336.1 hypothetical protein BXZ73DRAFT_49527 [Epithele typhae]